jgi:hypothetical protein
VLIVLHVEVIRCLLHTCLELSCFVLRQHNTWYNTCLVLSTSSADVYMHQTTAMCCVLYTLPCVVFSIHCLPQVPGWGSSIRPYLQPSSGPDPLPQPPPGAQLSLLLFARLATRCISTDPASRPAFPEITVELSSIAEHVKAENWDPGQAC